MVLVFVVQVLGKVQVLYGSRIQLLHGRSLYVGL